jgi:ribonuclease HI
MVSKKLKHYFQAHKIIVHLSFLLDNIFKNLEAIGRIRKWATEINDFTIEFVGRNTIKSQALTDFVADWTPDIHNIAEVIEPVWTVHTDEARGLIGADIAAILTSPSGIKLRYAARLEFQCINNSAEYEAIILALSKLRALSARRAIIKIDSQVISSHIEKTFKARDTELQKYLLTVRKIEGFFLGITTKPIPMIENIEVDELAKAAAQGTSLPSDIFYEIISQPSIEVNFKPPKLINAIHNEDWRAPIVAYLKGYHEPETKEEEKRMQ